LHFPESDHDRQACCCLKLCEKWKSRVCCGISKRSGNPGFQELTWSGFSTAFRPPIGVHFSPFSRVACASIRRAFDTLGVVHQPLEVFDERPFVVAESGLFLEGARAEIVAAIHNQIRALAELKK
jgi:hypothetical protein